MRQIDDIQKKKVCYKSCGSILRSEIRNLEFHNKFTDRHSILFYAYESKTICQAE